MKTATGGTEGAKAKGHNSPSPPSRRSLPSILLRSFIPEPGNGLGPFPDGPVLIRPYLW
jgi:hypothetical protein